MSESLFRTRFVRVGASGKVHVAERAVNGGWVTKCGLYTSAWRFGYWMQAAHGADEATCRRCAP